MRKPTIYEIKSDVENNSEVRYFFSPGTLKFFGQRLSDFHVKKSPSGRIFILATMYYDANHSAGYTFREYYNHNLIILYDDNGDQVKHGIYDLQEIYDFIQSH